MGMFEGRRVISRPATATYPRGSGPQPGSQLHRKTPPSHMQRNIRARRHGHTCMNTAALTHPCTQTYNHAHTDIHIYTYRRTSCSRILTSMYIQTYIYVYTDLHQCAHKTYNSAYINIHPCIYRHTPMHYTHTSHTCAHTYMHVQTRRRARAPLHGWVITHTARGCLLC